MILIYNGLSKKWFKKGQMFGCQHLSMFLMWWKTGREDVPGCREMTVWHTSSLTRITQQHWWAFLMTEVGEPKDAHGSEPWHAGIHFSPLYFLWVNNPARHCPQADACLWILDQEYKYMGWGFVPKRKLLTFLLHYTCASWKKAQ